MANTWILIRHPDKEGDKEGIYLGDTANITALGEQQISLVTARLKLMQPDAVTCSLLPRAQTLADRIAKDLGITHLIKSNLFNEIDKPKFLVGMKRTDPVHVEVMQAARDMFDGDMVPEHLLRGEKIKSRSELEAEVQKAFLLIEHLQPESAVLPAPSTVLTVTHAKRIAAFVHWVYLNDGTLKGYYDMADEGLDISTTGITVLSHRPNRRTGIPRWHIRTLNEECHTELGFQEKLLSLIQTIDTSDTSPTFK